MQKYVKLIDIVHGREMAKNNTPLYVKYKPDGEKVTFRYLETGWKEEQEAETEFDLNWQVIELPNDNILLVAEPTKFQLVLQGRLGNKNGILCQRKYARLYDNKKIGGVGIAVDMLLFNWWPPYLQNRDASFWLADDFKYFDGYRHYYGVKAICYGEPMYSNTESSEMTNYHPAFPLCPTVQLPSEIVADMSNSENDGSSPDKGLELIFRSWYAR